MPETVGIRVSTRRRTLVVSTVSCANIVGNAVRATDRPGVAVVTHQHGCGQIGDDMSLTQHVLAALAGHPNVVYTVFTALGCETNRAARLVELSAARGAETETVSIQATGGVEPARKRVLEILRRAEESTGGRSVPFSEPDDLGALTVAIVVERASEEDHREFADEVAGGLEGRGMRTIRARPISREAPGRKSSSALPSVPALWSSAPVGESTALQALLEARDEPPPSFVELGGTDVMRLTVLTALGAQLAVFLTNRGVLLSSPVAPTLGCSLSPVADELGDCIDVPFQGRDSADAIAEAVFRTASGRPCCAESQRVTDFDLPRLAPSY